MDMGMCDRCNCEPAVAFNDYGAALCEYCFSEDDCEQEELEP